MSTPKEELINNTIVAMGSIMNTYDVTEPDHTLALKVADGIFVVVKKDTKRKEYAMYFETVNETRVDDGYHFICYVADCNRNKHTMMKIINQIIEENNISGDILFSKKK